MKKTARFTGGFFWGAQSDQLCSTIGRGLCGISISGASSSTSSGKSASSEVSLLRTAVKRSVSSALTHLATTSVATLLPIKLVSARASDIKRSMPRINARPATGTVPTAESVAAKTMKPLPVTPAAPLEVSNKIANSVICCVRSIGVLVAWAMNTAAMVR